MKPNFALGLTDSGITLWMRDPAGWLRVGAVSLDASDLDAQMRMLVATAKEHAPDGVATKLVIPDEQILYSQLPVAPDPGAIRAALHDRTPYPVEELAYDWVAQDDGVLVAVVARETLAEAEDFAGTHGLNPVCFVAAPVDRAFTREPVFGRVPNADGPPQDCERGGAILRETGVAPAVQHGSGPATPDATDVTPAPPETARAPAAETGSAPDAAATGTPTATDTGKTDRPERPADDTSTAPFRSRRAAPETPVTAPDDADTPPSVASAPQSEALSALSKSRSLSLGNLGGAALAQRLRASVSGPVTMSDTAGHNSAGALARVLRGKRKTGGAQDPATPPNAPAPKADASTPPTRKPASRSTGTSKKPAGATPKPAKGAAADAKQVADPEAERLTLFGARRSATGRAPGTSQRVLAIGGAALLLALAVAVWMAYFTRMQEGGPSQPVLPDDGLAEIAAPDALTAPQTDADSAAEDDVAPENRDAAPGQQPDLLADAETPATGTVAGDTTPPDVAVPLQATGQRAALRSTWAIAPQSPPALPTVQAPPAPFGTTPLPPLRGAAPPDARTESQTAARRLPPGEDLLDIAVTQEPPAAVPPQRPAGIAPASAAESLAESASGGLDGVPDLALDESELGPIDVSDGTPPSVPPGRPEGLAPQPPAVDAPAPQDASDPEDDQAGLTPGPGGLELNMFSSPAARREAIAEEAVEQDAQFASATAQAVAASMRPSNRPDGFSRTVQRALAAASASGVQASAASVAPRTPSSASVARAATQAGAVDLREVNLLGVMGAPSARRALVRLDNGRVVTVEVGARLDGGQVVAIGDDQLRYTKGGRDLVLRLAS